MGLSTPDKIRTLQRKLYAKAKAEPEYRFYVLHDKVYRLDILEHAWRVCRANGGAPGVDGVTFQDIERQGVDGWLRALAAELKEETYRPAPVKRVMIPKPDGGERPLGIPTIRDRVAQTAAKLVLEPIFEADFEGNAYGYRPKRGALDAVNAVDAAICRGESQVVDADLSSYFDEIPHVQLMRSVARRISDRKMLRLIKMWLKSPVEATDDEGRKIHTGGRRSKRGVPQGGVISPLLANIYIHRLLRAWKQLGLERRLGARIINYADDLVIVSWGDAEAALQWLRWIVEAMGLRLNEAKTSTVDASVGSFDFLGYTFGPLYDRRTGLQYPGKTPSKKQRKRLKRAIRSLLRSGNKQPTDQVVAALNRRLEGWANYFSVGTLKDAYREIDRYTVASLRRFLVRRHTLPGRGSRRFSVRSLWQEHGLVCLQDRLRKTPLSHVLA